MKISVQIKDIIENNHVAVATSRKNNPYVIIVADCKVAKGGYIVISDNFMQRTVQNILLNKNVALVVWDKSWGGYQFLGKANYYKTGKWVDFVKSLKENEGFPTKGAILVKVEKIIKSK